MYMFVCVCVQFFKEKAVNLVIKHFFLMYTGRYQNANFRSKNVA